MLYADAVGVDMRPGPGVDVVADLETDDVGRFEHIDCLSVLEHCRRPWLMAANLQRMLSPGGTLHVQVPFVWSVHSYPDDLYRMTPSALRVLFDQIEWVTLKLATHGKLVDGPKTPTARVNGHRYIAQTVTCGFGRKR